jgi:hypothetical protein
MRTTIIPAQITTVEDTIAGNLNLTQILLLISSLFINTFIYSFLPVRLAFTMYKIPFIVLVFIVCIVLSLRIKQRIVLNWLVILATYAIRPHLYLFNKNAEFSRDIIQHKEKRQKTHSKVATPVIKMQSRLSLPFDYNSLIRNPSLNIRFKRNSVQVVKNYD